MSDRPLHRARADRLVADGQARACDGVLRRPERGARAVAAYALLAGMIGLVPLASGVAGAESDVSQYSPAHADDFPNRLLWGDTHVHSSFSVDANTMGNTRLSPADAYRFARGEPVIAANGMTARLETPLDFLVVSDHAEYMGLLPALRAGDERLADDPVAQRLAEGIRGDEASQYATIAGIIESLVAGEPVIDNAAFARSIWQEITALADRHDEPGRFSALIGFEWSSMPGGDNLHRVVVYRDAGDKASRLVPRSSFDGDRPEDLWTFMETYEAETGGRILAIPHNPNMSNGQMFALEDADGRGFDRRYALRRARHEPIAEITQIKGDSETHPLLSPDDEFADFETWDGGNIGVPPTPKQPGQIRYEYLRQALLHGLGEQARLGVNPFKLGFIGSTDAHTSLATGAENDFWGKLSTLEPSAHRLTPAPHEGPETTIFPWSWVASGYAAVWAHENTREAIFAAMQRREVYATSGSRITLRFFGGWDLEESHAGRPDATRLGYRLGVPMGADLPARGATADAAPGFLVSAQRDPLGAHLDRIQIVKGWRGEDGVLEEKVYDVALSDGRSKKGFLGLFGRPRDLPSTVDLETATYRNTVGAAELHAFWRDPDFDPAREAFYYARVLEIETPRWNSYDTVRFGLEPDPEAPRTVRDRAYSSPIWYTPN